MINVSVVRNLDDKLVDKKGNAVDYVLLINRGQDEELIVKTIPSNYFNDYDFMQAIYNALKEVKEDSEYAESKIVDEINIGKHLEMNEKCEKLLKDSRSISALAKKSFFAVNNNMIRFTLGHGASGMSIVEGGNIDFSLRCDGKISDVLPDLFLASNIHNLSKTIRAMESVKPTTTKLLDVLEFEEKKKVVQLRIKCDELSKEYINRAMQKDSKQTFSWSCSICYT